MSGTRIHIGRTGTKSMISGARRDIAARVGGATAALGIAAVLVLLGPRLADFPSKPGEVWPWFRGTPELALANCLGLIAWICLLWLCAGVVLGALAALPGAAGRVFAALARRVLPRAVRRIVEVGLGVTLVAASVSPLVAASPASAATTTGSAHATAVTQSVSAAPGGTGTASPQTSQNSWPFLGHDNTGPNNTGPNGSGLESTSTGSTSTGSADELRASVGDVLPDDLLIVPLTPVRAAGTATAPAQSTGLTAHAPGSQPAATTTTPASEQGWPSLSHPTNSKPGPPPSQPGASGTTSQPSPTRQSSPTNTTSPTSQPSPTRPTSATSRPATGQSTPSSQPSQPDTTTRPPAATVDPVVPAAPLGTGTPATAPGTPAQNPMSSADGSAEIVVLRGDSLWTIVARHLGPGATSDQIAAEWPRWWSANADVIGPDPDLILPGQRLVPPPPS
ncbi:LysM domain-containing protein [Frankia sp. CcI49]|uniref:LysM peptidoglycan-binding domain-containing protein n=1 Tax=Frankia sp. CcI49 TaxID=1745382 RepID=UPI0013043762|nr:LysM domain-containing protein [Frankia sp. CcI49]